MMKRLRHLPPNRRRQLVMLLGVVLLVLVYRRTRGASTATSSTDPALGDGTSAATGPYAPEWPTTTNDQYGYGLGSGGGGGGGGTTGGGQPPAPTGPSKPKHDAAWKRAHGYHAWEREHKGATLAERIAAIRRLIGAGRGNVATERGILAQLLRQRARQRQRDRKPAGGGGGGGGGTGGITVRTGGGGDKLAPPTSGGGVKLRAGGGSGSPPRVPTSGIARSGTGVQLIPLGRNRPRYAATRSTHTLGG